MTLHTISNNLPSDELVIRRIVRAIQKAVEEDVPDFYRENHMETMNSARYVRGDKINDNLRNFVVSDGIILISFKRYSWEGRMLVDEKNCITYTITTQQNLTTIPKKKNRSCPHFLQSILAIENGDIEDPYAQETLFPIDQFEEDVLEKDYMKIVSGVISSDSGYHHYVIAYDFEKSQLLDVKMMLLDKRFSTVSEHSLNDFINPDFAQLTAGQPNSTEHTPKHVRSARDLVTIKPGVLPNLIDLEDEAKKQI